jgi:D-alanyl-D-alanine-carboxypeptidase/D-alanyl-D-alanine-endopeptidase
MIVVRCMQPQNQSEGIVLSVLSRRVAAWSLAIGLTTSVSAAAGLLPERVGKVAQDRVAAGMYRTLVFGVVDGDRSEIVAVGKLDDGKAPDGDTVYEIGSITKTFTATLFAQAMLSGRVTFEPVAPLGPSFQIPPRGGLEVAPEEPAPRPRLPRLRGVLPKDPRSPEAGYDEETLRAFLAGSLLLSGPRAAYDDDIRGFGLLGYALARLERTTYGALVDDGILSPLGMTMSGTALSDAMRARLAPGHGVSGEAAKGFDFDQLAGAGAIRSTASDMLRYLKANMGVDQTPLAAAMKLARQPPSDTVETAQIGRAWMTTGNGIIWHNGETGGYRSFLGFTADGRRGVVILTNTAVDVDDLGFATLAAETPLAIVLPGSSLDDYVGTYRVAGTLLLKIFRWNDGLFVQATGQGPIRFFPSAPDEFFAEVASASISFARGPDGTVGGLVLHRDGDHAAARVSASELPPEPKDIAFDAAAAGDYVGRYRFTFGPVLDVVLKSDHLEARITGQPAFPLFPSGKDTFFCKLANAQLAFERDDDDKILAVALHVGGRHTRAPRMAPQQ